MGGGGNFLRGIFVWGQDWTGQGAGGRIITETSNESLIGWSHSFWEEKQKVICSNLLGGSGAGVTNKGGRKRDFWG